MAIIDPSKVPSLEDVNAHLLERLDVLIQDAEAEELLKIAETVAKLNASSRNNDLVAARVDEAALQAQKEQEMFGHLAEGEAVPAPHIIRQEQERLGCHAEGTVVDKLNLRTNL